MAKALCQAVLDAATVMLAKQDGAPEMERVLKHYREDAGTIAVAVLSALAGTRREPGLMPCDHKVSKRLRALALEVESTSGLQKSEWASA
jgi:hypothetical protein